MKHVRHYAITLFILFSCLVSAISALERKRSLEHDDHWQERRIGRVIEVEDNGQDKAFASGGLNFQDSNLLDSVEDYNEQYLIVRHANSLNVYNSRVLQPPLIKCKDCEILGKLISVAFVLKPNNICVTWEKGKKTIDLTKV
ncbi:MAG: hypothetical protein H6679_00920 [Epsilonproteobacteria bacterium]|nr:hypothetical protein [Campylobacterota bacterium]